MEPRTASGAAAAWVGLAALAIANGMLRELMIEPRLGERAGHLLSTLLLALVIFFVAYALVRGPWRRLPRRDLVLVGGGWFALTLAFEFLFGHYVMGVAWGALLAEYDVFAGRVWVLVPIVTLVAPAAARRVIDARARRRSSGSPARPA